jgi:hypothetical protein
VHRVGFEERFDVALWRARVVDEVKTAVGSGMSKADPDPPRIWKTVSPSSGMKAST